MSNPHAQVGFDHTIIPARDKHRSASFFAEIFGLPEPREAGYFLEVRLTDGRIFEFAEPGIDFPGQHFAFLVDDATFDAVLDRLQRADVTLLGRPATGPTRSSAARARSTPTMVGEASTSTTPAATTSRRSRPATTGAGWPEHRRRGAASEGVSRPSP